MKKTIATHRGYYHFTMVCNDLSTTHAKIKHIFHACKWTEILIFLWRYTDPVSTVREKNYSATINFTSSWFHVCIERKRKTRQFTNLSREKNDRHFADDIFKQQIFLNEKVRFLTKISLKFVPKGPFHNNPALVLIMAWRRIGDKPLSETMLTWITDAYICGTGGRWV